MKSFNEEDLSKSIKNSHKIALATTLVCLSLSLFKAVYDSRILHWPVCISHIERPDGNLLENRNSTGICLYKYVIQGKEYFGRIAYTDLINIKSYSAAAQTVMTRYDAGYPANSIATEPSILQDIVLLASSLATYPIVIFSGSPEAIAVSSRRAIQAATRKISCPAVVGLIKSDQSSSDLTIIKPKRRMKPVAPDKNDDSSSIG